MCRILFLKGINNEKALDYIDAFYKAGFDDPHLEIGMKNMKISKIKNQHIHGWGYLLVTEKNINTYLNGEAFFEDKIGFDNLKEQVKNIDGNFLLMAEFRLTDEGYVSALNSHPFFFSSNNGYEGWFFYNGLLDREKLTKLEGFNYENFKKKNGTTIMGHCFSKELENGKSIKEALLSPKKALKSGYNLMCFLNNNNGEYKAYLNAYSKEELLKNNDYKEFIKIIKKEEKDLFFAGSNSISFYKKDKYDSMKNGEFLEFDINWIKEFYFNPNDIGVENINL